MAKGKDYETGYGKPPKSGRFKKGRSGNPRGRPKGSQDFGSDLRDVLKARVSVVENGNPKRVSSQKATLMRLREKALKGDDRAMGKLLDLAKELGAEEQAKFAAREVSQNERDILERFEMDIREEAIRHNTTGQGDQDGEEADDHEPT